MNLINLVEDMDSWRACVSAVISIRITKTAENVSWSSGTASFCSRTLHFGVRYTLKAFMKAEVRRKFEDEGEEPTESVPVSNLGEWWFTGYLDCLVFRFAQGFQTNFSINVLPPFGQYYFRTYHIHHLCYCWLYII
jgi:hypothetical protein